MVEAALSLVLFLTVVFGIMDFGRLNWERTLLAHAARAGVRYAIVHGENSGRTAYAQDVSTVVKQQAVGLDPNVLQVTTTWSPDKKPGSNVQVQVSYNFSSLLPFVPLNGIVLSSSSRMVISQ
jgi:Flp pilus assembly protein TadG